MGAEQGKAFVAVDFGADGTTTVISYDGQVYRFLGYVDDAGRIIPDVRDRFYIRPDGARVEIPELPGLPMQVPAFTVPLRQADRILPTLLDQARPRCPKCSTLLAPCDVCGGPAQCGDTFCAEHQPD